MNQILKYIDSHPRETKRIIGITYEQFANIVDNAIIIETTRKKINAFENPTIISPGGGRKKKLTVPSEILLTLYYLHNIPTFHLLGINFNISESTAHKTFHYWLDILKELLPASLVEQVKKKENEYLWILEYLTELELIVDSTETRRQRPSDYQKQKEYYSGKKKDHTWKNQLITTPFGTDIIDVITGEKGKESDVNLLRRQQNNFNKDQIFQGDKGYIGVERTITPMKKQKNKELTEEIKKDNKLKAEKRIYVEHIIRLIKVFRVIKER